MKNYAIDYLKKLNDSARFVPEFRKDYGMPLWDNELFFDHGNSKVLLFPVNKGKTREMSALLYFVFGREGFSFNTIERGETYEEFGETEPLFYWVEFNVYGRPANADIMVELPERNDMLKDWIGITNCWSVYSSLDNGLSLTYLYTMCTTRYHWIGGRGSFGGGANYHELSEVWSGGGGVGGGGSPEPPVVEPSDSLQNIAESFINFSFSDLEKLNNILDEFIQDCYNKQIYDYFITNGIKFFFVINSGLGGNASYNHNTRTISFRSISDIKLLTLREELFHAYQHNFYGYSTTVKSSNIEFEAKLFAALMDFPIDLCCFYQMGQTMPQEFEAMILLFFKENMDFGIIEDYYFDFLQYWHENRAEGYKDYILLPGFYPNAIKTIFINSECPLIIF